MGYGSDVRDEEREFCAPYLHLMDEQAPRRTHRLRAVFDALRWFVRAGCPWLMLPNDLPPWWVVQQQTRRWIKAGCFEAMAADLRAVARIAAGREHVVPTAVVLDSRTLPSTPESGGRVELAYVDQGYTGEKPAAAAAAHKVRLEVIKHTKPKRGFVLLPRRWVVERSFA